MAFAAPLLPILAIGVGVAGVAVSTASAIAQNNYQKQVAQRNAAIAEINAQRATTQAQSEQLKQDQETRALLGEQIAAQSASGLKLGGRSQMLTRKSARQLGRMDAVAIREAGDVEAWNFRQIAAENYDQIKFLQQSSNFALLSGFLDAASIGISGLSKTNMFGATKTVAKKDPWYTAGRSALRFAR